MSASSHICFELFALILDIVKLYLLLMENLQKLKWIQVLKKFKLQIQNIAKFFFLKILLGNFSPDP